MVRARDCQGYGVYEGVGATTPASLFPTPALPAPGTSALAPRPTILQQFGPMVLQFGPQAAPPLPPSHAVAQPQLRVIPLVTRPLRPAFRLVLQPVRRSIQVPMPLPRQASPVAVAAAQQLVVPATSTPYTIGVAPRSSGGITADVLPGVPVVPGLPALGFTQHGNLWMVDPAQLSVVSTILSQMDFTMFDVPDVDSVGAHASFVLGVPQSSSAWNNVLGKNAQGFAVLVEKASVPTGTLNFIITQSFGTLAMLAGGPAAPYALITDQPSALVDLADQSLSPIPPNLITPGPGQTETGTCPPGTTGAPPDCVPVGSPGGGVTPAAMTSGGVSWWSNLSTTEKVVGVGALALVAVAVATHSRKKTS